jgi:phage protein D
MPTANLLPLDIYVGQDFYAPAFRLMVRGKQAQVQNYDVLSVTYQDSLTDIDSFDMTVLNWDSEKRAFKYSDADTFDPGQEVELHLGYYRNGQDELRRMLIGEITTLSPHFPASGGPTLTVRALNLLHRFRTQQITRPFVNTTDADIARLLVSKIAEEINSIPSGTSKDSPRIELQLDTKDLEKNKSGKPDIEYLLINNQFPILFLMERARRLGYELTLDEPFMKTRRLVTLRYRPTSDVKDPTYVLEWGKSLIEFQPNLQTANQVSAVIARGWDPSGKTKLEAKVTRADLAAKNAGIVNPIDLGIREDSGLAQKREIVVDRPIQSQEELEELAKNTLLQIGLTMVEAKGKTVGLPDLRTGVKVQIKGLGSRFSGPDEKHLFSYLITSTTHTVSDSGYTTDFSARMEKSF